MQVDLTVKARSPFPLMTSYQHVEYDPLREPEHSPSMVYPPQPDNPGPGFRRPSPSSSSQTYHSSPLNPGPGPRRFSSYTSAPPHLRQMPSEDSRALSGASPSPAGSMSRGSMILYRFDSDEHGVPEPPKLNHLHSNSTASSSRNSIMSISADSKYPLGGRGVIAYAYDPFQDDPSPESDDPLHDPKFKDLPSHNLPWRGLLNVGTIVLVVGSIIAVFVMYPIFRTYRDDGTNQRIVGNVRINSTGQASEENVPVDRRRSEQAVLNSPIPFSDPSFPSTHRTSPEGVLYELVFSDEFEDDDRDFAQDPTWMAIRQPFKTMNGSLIVSPNSGGLRLRTPLCIDDAFLEVGIRSDASEMRLFWNDGWIQANLNDQTPRTPTARRIVRLDIRIDPIPYNNHDILLDYIRLYSRTSASCASDDTTLHMYLVPHVLAFRHAANVSD